MSDDEMTPGEVGRSILRIERAVRDLAGRVLTVEVWKAEREALELRIRENEKDVAAAQAELDTKADKSVVAELRAQQAETERKRSDNFKYLVGVALTVAGLVIALVAAILQGASS